MADETEDQTEIGWAICELFGHRRLAGNVSTEQIGGASFLRIDVPHTTDGETTTQFYSPSAVYCLTPTTEEIARAFADRNHPAPVSRYELAPIGKVEVRRHDEDDEDF